MDTTDTEPEFSASQTRVDQQGTASAPDGQQSDVAETTRAEAKHNENTLTIINIDFPSTVDGVLITFKSKEEAREASGPALRPAAIIQLGHFTLYWKYNKTEKALLLWHPFVSGPLTEFREAFPRAKAIMEVDVGSNEVGVKQLIYEATGAIRRAPGSRIVRMGVQKVGGGDEEVKVRFVVNVVGDSFKDVHYMLRSAFNVLPPVRWARSVEIAKA